VIIAKRNVRASMTDNIMLDEALDKLRRIRGCCIPIDGQHDPACAILLALRWAEYHAGIHAAPPHAVRS